jgi:hypothetical protein
LFESVKDDDLPVMFVDRQSARAATLVQINPTAPTASSAAVRRDAMTFLRGLKQKRSS